MDIKKQSFIEAYQKTFGNIAQSCRMSGVKTRQTFYDWMKIDAEFKAIIDGIEPAEDFLDFCESALRDRINDKDTTAIIFALKTKGKKRGYIERQEIEQTAAFPPIQLIFPNDPTAADTV